jgi:hypothetical protein
MGQVPRDAGWRHRAGLYFYLASPSVPVYSVASTWKQQVQA